jgi:hypothetical protein
VSWADILAGLGAGAQSLGGSLVATQAARRAEQTRKAERDEARAEREAQTYRALAMTPGVVAGDDPQAAALGAAGRAMPGGAGGPYGAMIAGAQQLGQRRDLGQFSVGGESRRLAFDPSQTAAATLTATNAAKAAEATLAQQKRQGAALAALRGTRPDLAAAPELTGADPEMLETLAQSGAVGQDRLAQIQAQQAGRQPPRAGGGRVPRGTSAPKPAPDTTAPLKVTPKQAEQARGLDELTAALDNYEALLQKRGPQLYRAAGDGDDYALASAYTGAKMGLKNLFELGALAGPDVAILEELLAPPIGPRAKLAGEKGLTAQIAQARQILATKRGLLAGGPNTPAPPTDGPRVEPVALPPEYLARVRQLKAQGMSKAQAAAILQREFPNVQ